MVLYWSAYGYPLVFLLTVWSVRCVYLSALYHFHFRYILMRAEESWGMIPTLMSGQHRDFTRYLNGKRKWTRSSKFKLWTWNASWENEVHSYEVGSLLGWESIANKAGCYLVQQKFGESLARRQIGCFVLGMTFEVLSDSFSFSING